VSVFQDIRGALTVQANTAAGLPGDKAYEGVPYTPVVGTAYVAYALVPTAERPRTLGQYGDTIRQGLFQASLFFPSGSGTGLAESAADAVRAKFPPGQVVTQNETVVRVRYAERAPAQAHPDWVMVPVTVAWTTRTSTTPLLRIAFNHPRGSQYLGAL